MARFQPQIWIAVVLCAICSARAEGTGLGGGAENGALKTERHFYLLQADRLAKRVRGDDATKRSAAITTMAAVVADTFVIDQYFADSPNESGLYTPDELTQLRAGQTTGVRQRVLLSYLSIGEAEDYRYYWQQAWAPKHNGKIAATAPNWLLGQNPDWKGNYRVKYWNADWQALIFGSPTASLDRIIAQGFDGAYLDIIDGFETFENGSDNLVNPETGQSYRRDMVDFVMKLAAYARAIKPGFLVVPQNGSQLLDFDNYLTVISGQGQEDLYYNTNKMQPQEESASIVERLKRVSAVGKAVLVTDYSRAKKKQADDIAKARADGFSVFIAPRKLNGLGRLP